MRQTEHEGPRETRGITRRQALAGGLASTALLLPGTAGWAKAATPAHTFRIVGDHFEFDGQPAMLISGEIHYARVPREYWRNRIQMLRAMGCNTLATYVFWNVHEPKPGQYDFNGNYDLAEFIRIAGQEGLHVILRAGPYSCAEWEFGGFPAWLLKDPKMTTALRSNDPAFMVPAERWMRRLAAETAPLMLSRGGPIVAVQIENEYGNFGGDIAYMQHLHEIFQSTPWSEGLLYTVDPSKALARGSLPGVFSGVNFGTGHAGLGLDAAAALRPGQPLFATEYWPGWFDLWGHPHETRPLDPQLGDLNVIFSRKASINIYMFHGGTNFGMWPGASASTGSYRGNVTSYDYDAPLDEAGHPTPKFFAYRDVILKYTGGKPLPLPAVAPVVAIPEFPLQYQPAMVNLPKPVPSEQPLTMEQVDQAYGYILYRKQVPASLQGAVLKLDGMKDFAVVLVNGTRVGTLDRHYHQDSLPLTTNGPARLDVLIENTGRLNSTKAMRLERKGMTGASLDGMPLTDWEIVSLPMSSAPLPPSGTAPVSQQAALDPQYGFGHFELNQVGDAYLDVTSLGKGLIWINGHALGRFWNIGPQDTLYVPGPWLRKGKNEVAVFDVLPTSPQPKLVGRMKPILDGPTPGYVDDPERKRKAAADAEFGPKLAAPASPANPAPPQTPKE